MTVLVVGATGATGRRLVEQLLQRKRAVRAVVRSPERIPSELRENENLSLIEASLLDLTDAELSRHVCGCTAIASCLGHNLTLKGIFGHPRRLVADATRRLCDAVLANPPPSPSTPPSSSDAPPSGRQSPTRFVLMNTAGNSNRDLDEPLSFAHRCVMGLVRTLVPPQPDNEQAADYLRTQVGQKHESIEWVVVRPDTLLDEDSVTPYDVHPSPTRSAVFNPGTTSRINVADFMARLVTEEALWAEWKGRMPVIYNAVLPDGSSNRSQ